MVSDGKGLYLRIRESGTATWTFRYRFAGRDVWMPLGDARDMALTEARCEARAQRVLVDKRIDPLSQRRTGDAAKRAKEPFRRLADRWYAGEIVGRLKHPLVVRRALDNHILPRLGRKRPEEISPADCAAVLDAIRKSKPAAANDVLRYIEAIFRLARRHHVVQASPVADFNSKDTGGKESKRERALSRYEIGEFLKAIREF